MEQANGELARLRELEEELSAEVALELVELFLEDAPEQFSALRQALGGHEADILMRTAHSLKGSCSNLGLDELARLAAELEVCAHDGGCTGAAAQLGVIEAEFARVKEVLGRYRAELQTRS